MANLTTEMVRFLRASTLLTGGNLPRRTPFTLQRTNEDASVIVLNGEVRADLHSCSGITIYPLSCGVYFSFYQVVKICWTNTGVRQMTQVFDSKRGRDY